MEPRPEALISQYAQTSVKEMMSLDDAITLSRHLGYLLSNDQPRPEVVIGIANGGLLVAKVVATELGIPYRMLRIRRKITGVKRSVGRLRPLVRFASAILAAPGVGLIAKSLLDRMKALETDATELSHLAVNQRAVVIIDDCVESGRTLAMARQILSDAGARSVHVGVLSRSNSVEKPLVEPDACVCRRIHTYPWSENSPHYPSFREWLSQEGFEAWQ
jgi:adenine/guanine phosphoribosyltransferase-like PRPP-binding protein